MEKNNKEEKRVSKKVSECTIQSRKFAEPPNNDSAERKQIPHTKKYPKR